MSSKRGLLFVISAPSGTGKTTLVERLVQILPNLRMSRSYTSRAIRAGEREGVDYHFISRAEFEAMIAANAFLEWADVFGNYYGTAAADVERMLAQGQDVVLVIDVQGARQVRQRGTDTEAALQRRLETARAEVSSYREYDYVVVNDDLEPTVVRLQEIIAAERSRVHRMTRVADAIVRTFFGDTPHLA